MTWVLSHPLSPPRRWLYIALYAIAMAYLESAVVFYLRTMVGRLEPYQPNPLPDIPALGIAELWRELATMVMLATVGCLTGSTWRGRFGYSLLIFGVWDIFYYIFLIPLTNWPDSLADWDILFLIPLPWWGPVWAPISIALLMLAFGFLSTCLEQAEPPLWPRKLTGILGVSGILLALYVFMADATAVVPQGIDALRNLLPLHFLTIPFLIALMLMAAPVIDMAKQLLNRYRL